jgi:hypothetical protein
MRGKSFTLIVMLVFFASSAYAIEGAADSLWQVLTEELQKERGYINRKEQKIQVLRQRLAKAPAASFNPRFKLAAELFGEYSAYRFDSALTTVHTMIALSKKFGDQESLFQSQKVYATTLIKSGFYREASDVLATIDTTRFTKHNRYEFLLLRARLYGENSAYNNDAYFAKRYSMASQRDYKEALAIVTPDETERTIDLAFSEGVKKPSAKFYYNYLLNNKFTEHQIAMLATRVSHAYSGDDKLMLLTLATIHDVRSSIKETVAMFLLGQELFRQKRNEDAYLCMNESLKNAAFYGTRNRTAQIEAILPLIANSLIAEQKHEKNMLWVGIAIFLSAAAVLFVQLVLFRKQMIRIKKNDEVIREQNIALQDLNGKLWETSRIKEELIGLFFKTCSSYIETLDKVKRKAQHKIKIGKYQDATLVLGDVHIQTEKKELYHTLDRVFLTLFPNFIASFNSLLKQEDQILLKEGEILTATLRIYALIRLGISDVETIASILDYTVNTVYTYKARIKAKASVPPEEFEQKIMSIKFTDGR